MSRIEVKDKFSNMTDSEVRELVNRHTDRDITEIRNKDPKRHYVHVKDNPTLIAKFQSMGYEFLNETTSRGEVVTGAGASDKFGVLDTHVMYTDHRVRKELERRENEEHRKRLGSYRREAIREIREAEKEHGVPEDRRGTIEVEEKGRFRKINSEDES